MKKQMGVHVAAYAPAHVLGPGGRVACAYFAAPRTTGAAANGLIPNSGYTSAG
ncbi:hypothetical protein SPHI_21220 [Sphingomonas jeddahensis]|uniref:Uncharacterized protein n=1 Tax=Sphingomonas jeddahensis TaxID=1915074 RepID=A0A1V2ET76_9SPHN|nr:hypothetical protein SPHI_21220 [Sphingomonas jeddahensis]